MKKYYQMKLNFIPIIFILFTLQSFKEPQERLSCTSPDGRISLRVNCPEKASASISVLYGKDTITRNSSLGIIFNDPKLDFSSGLNLLKTEKKSIMEKYRMKTGKQNERINHCNELELTLKNKSNEQVVLDLRVYNEGVAFRYRFAALPEVSVIKETSGYLLDGISKIWSIKYNSYDEQLYGDIHTPIELEGSNLSFPVLINTKAGYWALISESNVSNFPLSCGKFENEKLGYVFANEKAAVNAVSGDFVSPWRVMILGSKVSTIVESCLIDHLAPATAMTDLSWIEPGIASFPWWANNLANSSDEAIKSYIDLSAVMNWRFVEFDLALVGSRTRAVENWKTSTWIKDVVDYGKQKGVLCYGWDEIANLNTSEKREDIFSRYNALGMVGIKVDYVNSYSQQTRKILEEIIQSAADHHLMVSFHGAQSPRGFARQYPNMVTLEAVMGEEYYLSVNGSKGLSAKHNCTLPFTRNVLGSMDYTPVGFSSKLRTTTMAHELALSVVFESGWQGLCDAPESYLNSLARTFLSQLVSSWDETRLLDGYPGEYCCIARRKGDTWFIAGINSGVSRTVSMKLPIKSKAKVQVYNDFSDDLNRLTVTEGYVTPRKPFEINMRKNGGFAFIVRQ